MEASSPLRGTGLRTLSITLGALLVVLGMVGFTTLRIAAGARIGAAALGHQALPLDHGGYPIPSDPAPQGGPYPLGMGASYEDIDAAGRSVVTVLYARRAPYCHGSNTPQGYELLLIAVRVVGATGRAFSNPLFWNFTTNQGQEVVQHFSNCDVQANAQRLPTTSRLGPGDSAMGYLEFEVPNGFGGTLAYQRVTEELAAWTVPNG